MLKNKFTYILIAVAFIACCAVGGWMLASIGSTDKDKQIDDTSNTETTTSVTNSGNVLDSDNLENDMGSTVKINGKTYGYNKKLKTLLFMGVDTKESVEAQNILGSGGRADVIMLFVLNEEERSVQILEISRDTIVDVDVYNHDRELLYSGKMQINMQYAFSDSHARGCTLMKRKVSELLYGIKIDNYLSLTMDGISAAADAMGGLEVTMNQDWTEIDSTYTKGTTVLMSGEEAERFIRYRDTNVLGSNDTRMERNAYLLQQMVAQIKKQNTDGLTSLLNALEPYMESDMDGETIKKLVSYQLSDDVLKVPGQTIAGENHDEYYVDESALQDMILQLFYTPID